MSALHSKADVPGLGLLPNQLSPEVQPGPFAPDMALCPLSARLEQQGGTQASGNCHAGEWNPYCTEMTQSIFPDVLPWG